MSKNLIFFSVLALAALVLTTVLTAQETINITTTDVTTNLTTTNSNEIVSPFADNSRVCIFIREWILKSVFIVILLVFLLGVAVMSGAAFPDWRDHGSKMILGAVGAVILYLIGLPALKFLMGVSSLCGL